MFKILSLFDGISALQVALNNIGIKDYSYYASEIDKYAIKVTQGNYPNTIQLGDIRDISFGEMEIYEKFLMLSRRKKTLGIRTSKFECWHEIPSIDLLCGGSPCQDLSISKQNRQGLKGERSGLFYEYVRILKEIKPKFFILENVASMPKDAKNTITQELYNIEPTLLNSSLVTAQQRKRLFWVGRLQEDGSYAKVEIEQPQDKNIFLQDILGSGASHQDKAHTLTATYNKAVIWNTLEKKQRTMIFEPTGCALRGRYNENGKVEQKLEIREDSKANCITTVSKDSLVVTPILYNQYNQRTLKEKSGTLTTSSNCRTAISGQVVVEPIVIEHIEKGGQAQRIYSVAGKSVCLSANSGDQGARTGLYKIDLPDGEYSVRKLTPTECEKLQGFPIDYTNHVSNTQRYKALGNSFTVPIIEHILQTIFQK